MEEWGCISRLVYRGLVNWGNAVSELPVKGFFYVLPTGASTESDWTRRAHYCFLTRASKRWRNSLYSGLLSISSRIIAASS